MTESVAALVSGDFARFAVAARFAVVARLAVVAGDIAVHVAAEDAVAANVVAAVDIENTAAACTDFGCPFSAEQALEFLVAVAMAVVAAYQKCRRESFSAAFRAELARHCRKQTMRRSQSL